MNSLTAGLESIAPRLGMTLMHSLWQGAVIAILLAVMLRLLRSESAVLRYTICCGAMVLLVASVASTFAMLAPALERPVAVQPAMDVPVPPLNFATASPSHRVAPVSAPPIDPMRWAGLAWLIGASAVAMWHLVGWLWIRRCVKGLELDAHLELAKSLGIRRAVRLIESTRLNVPAVVGVFRPVILLPLGLMNDLPPEQIEAILIHELAHIRRHDYLVNLLQVVAESLLFYHPATWWISSQIRREREHCCDDIAASRYTAGRYVSALLALEQRRSPGVHMAVAATGGSLFERAQRLLGCSADDHRRPLRSAVAALIVLSCVVAPVVVVGCKKQSSPPATQSVIAAVGTEDATKASGITADDFKADYSVLQIGTGDLLSVQIPDLVGLGVQTVVQKRVSDPDGEISLPYLKKGMKVTGLTDAEAQRAISRAYREGEVITDAVITVTRIELTSTRYTVLGQGVGRPGEFTIAQPDYRLTAALATAAVDLDGQKAILILRKAGGTRTRTLRIPVAALMAGDSSVDVSMRPGDVVMLPPADKPSVAPTVPPSTSAESGEYYMGGPGIKRVGVYSIPRSNISVRQAIIAAGPISDESTVQVIRRDGGKVSWVLNGSYSSNSSGSVDDVFLHPGDTVMVGVNQNPSQRPSTLPAP